MKLSLSKKIILTIETIAIVVIVLVVSASYLYTQSVIKQNTNIRLSNISNSKENYIKQYLDYRIKEIDSIVDRDHVKEGLISLLKENNTEPKSLNFLIDDIVDVSEIIDISLLNKDGVIVASNNLPEVGKIRTNELYFKNSQENTYVESFVYDNTFKKNIIILATPVKDENFNTVGVVVNKINTDTINTLMSDSLGLGKTGETYLVNSENIVITSILRHKNIAIGKISYSPQVNLCLGNHSNFYINKDYSDHYVYGYARWVPLIQACLISEIDKNEIMEPILNILPQAVAIIIIILLLVLILGYFLSESISKPITTLRNQAIRIRNGDLDVQIEPTSNDEIGDMATSFKEMILRLKELYQNLESKVVERTKKLEDSEKKLEKSIELYEINNKIMTGREIEMVKLKEHIKELEQNQK